MEIDLGNIRFEAILGLSGILMLIASFAPWEYVGSTLGSALGTWQGNAAFAGSWIVIIATIIKYRFLNLWELERFSPYTDAVLGGFGAFLGLLGSLTFQTSPKASLAWGFYLILITSLVSGFSAFMIYRNYRRSGLPQSKSREHAKLIR